MKLYFEDHVGLPWWHSTYESARQCRRHDSIPGSGTITRAMERLSPAPRVLSQRSEPGLCNKRSRRSEKPAHRPEAELHSLQRGQSPSSKENPAQPRIKIHKVTKEEKTLVLKTPSRQRRTDALPRDYCVKNLGPGLRKARSPLPPPPCWRPSHVGLFLLRCALYYT